MTKIGSEEAKLLESTWAEFSKEQINATYLREKLLPQQIANSLARVNVARAIERVGITVDHSIEEMDVADEHHGNMHLSFKMDEEISTLAKELGVGIEVTSPVWMESHWTKWTHVSDNIRMRLVSIDVCRALNLLEAYAASASIVTSHLDDEWAIRVFHFTSLGIEFMKVTHSDIGGSVAPIPG